MTEDIIKIYYETLPKYKENGTGINWDASIGHKIKFQCLDIQGEMEILYKDGNKAIYVRCDNKILRIPYTSFLKSEIKKYFRPFTYKFEIGENIKDEKRDMVITGRYVEKNKKDNRYQKRYYYHCNNCTYDGEIAEQNLRLDGCACCARKIVVPGINDITTTDPWMIPYFQGGKEEAKLYLSGSNKEIVPICPICKRIKHNSVQIALIKKHHGISCSCSDNISYPEKFFMNVLEQLNIKYTYQLSNKNQKWIKNSRYDFYIDDKKCIVEINGDQHNTSHGNWADIEKIKQKDKEKEELAKLNNIKYYITIDCRYSTMEYIKNSILNSEFINLYDMSDIDWVKCDEFATKNLVKQVCSLWKDDYSISSGDIATLFHLNINTISKYLKQGASLGWCNYDAKQARIYSGKNRTKIVFVYRNDICITSYNSIKELIENSFNDFNIKLTYDGIYRSNKNNVSYKGYYFKINEKR